MSSALSNSQKPPAADDANNNEEELQIEFFEPVNVFTANLRKQVREMESLRKRSNSITSLDPYGPLDFNQDHFEFEWHDGTFRSRAYSMVAQKDLLKIYNYS